MYYKVMKDNKVIDVLDELVFLKYQKKHNRMLLCDKREAQAIFSSNKKTMWHMHTLRELPIPGYDTVYVEEIDEYDYKRLKALNCGTAEDIIDEFVLSLISDNADMFAESLKRLYIRREIDENKVMELCEKHNITESKQMYVLEN